MSSPGRPDDELGMTVAELAIASLLLMAALALFLGSLDSIRNTSTYQAGRTQALDELRTTADAFSKDARHATAVVEQSGSHVVLRTYVDGNLRDVRYEVRASGGQTNLERTAVGDAARLFVIRLTSASIFTFDNADPTQVRRVKLHMETLPDQKYQPVVLATEVSLRNVR